MGNYFSRKPIDMSSASAQFVREIIGRDKVVIFSKTYCPYCKMAKEQFKKLNQAVTVIELETRDDASEIQDVLGELTGARTVPRVFINGNFIGGGTDVQKMYNDGRLQKVLEE
ncbi:Glutaredoxin [Sergentomyia squamirostris]